MNKDKKFNYYTYTLSMGLLNVFSIVLLIGVVLVVFFLERGQVYVVHVNMLMLFLLMFLYLIFHELLHGVGFLLGKGVHFSHLCFGMALEKGVFYCMCKQKIGKRDILRALLFPVVWIGFVTLGIGMYFNWYELVFLSIMNIASSIGDLVMAIFFWKCPEDILYLDLDDCTSFTVISQQDLAKIQVRGIVLRETGLYDEGKMCSRDKRKFVISRPSYYLLGVITLLIILYCIVRGGI